MNEELQTNIAWLVVDEYKDIFQPVSMDEFLVAEILNVDSTIHCGNIGIQCINNKLASWTNIHIEPEDLYKHGEDLKQLLVDPSKYEYSKPAGSAYGLYSKGHNIANPDSIPMVKRLVDHVVDKVTNHPDWRFRCPKN